MHILGCGVDIIEISRVEKALENPRFRDRVYTRYEQDALALKKAPSWAARFAAKEAVMKAMGTGWQRGVGFSQIEVSADQWGKPYVQLSGRAAELSKELGIVTFFLSLSHSKEYAVASVVAVGEE